MSRLYFLTFWGKFRGTHEQEHHLHESPLSMTVPLIVLAILSVGGGFIVNIFMEHNLAPTLADVKGEENHTLHTLMWGVTAAVLAVVGYAYSVYVMKGTTPETDENIEGFTKTVYNKYYIDELYNSLITKPLDSVSRFFSSVFDTQILDGIINGVGSATRWLSGTMRLAQNGNVGVYFFAMVVAIILILAFKTF